MTKKSPFRKPATDAILEYMHEHKTSTFAELIAALPQYKKHTLQIAREALRQRKQIVRLRENNKDVKRGKPAQIVFTLGEGRSKKERLAAARNPNNNPVSGLGSSVAGIFKGYKPTRVVGKGTYKGESWGNVRDGALDPNRPRIRGVL